MTWPLPTPEDIAARAAAVIEAQFPGIDARTSTSAAGVLARAIAMSVYEVWLHQRRLADEMLPDTAADWLERLASIWGVPRNAATAATGLVQFSGAAGLVVPSGVQARGPTGARYTTTAGGPIAGDGTLIVAARADDTGTAGYAAAGTVLDLVSPIGGLTAQTATVQAPGLTGGRATDSDEVLRARLLAQIREPSRGGAAADYDKWARAVAGIGYVSVEAGGLGTVRVIVALDGPAAAQPGDVTNVTASIEAARPVTAAVTVLAATLLPVALTVAVTPDTQAVRTAVQGALTIFFATDARIGQAIPLSRISEAISAASGEYSHRIVSPTSTVTPSSTQLPVLGTITWSS
ncbi:baseplate J/gp47 family protein [Roseomonas sp. HJA6]|uniref:Baseplate J/gp47 family protein n=1 Tax=Roseomonas alba TaxID=2846776 RepID=A0ABS7AJ48_9PROT|nr:baseplate J/gp47 family protein [Neoroseomonas alba]MBW6402090.1 baseplate J/gp47 family protein [Neoroseomonas alba]